MNADDLWDEVVGQPDEVHERVLAAVDDVLGVQP